jgi:hypothetical protein
LHDTGELIEKIKSHDIARNVDGDSDASCRVSTRLNKWEMGIAKKSKISHNLKRCKADTRLKGAYLAG